MTTITKDRLLTIQHWRETYGPGSKVVLPAEEAEELARIALASLVAVSDERMGYGAWLDYLVSPRRHASGWKLSGK
ncbi:hypothetical protein PSE22_004825 [Escherichia coli]|nr:hypothetical protein [Escherichia coli]EMA0552053.1 hypothetical protein [Escherichia coli]